MTVQTQGRAQILPGIYDIQSTPCSSSWFFLPFTHCPCKHRSLLPPEIVYLLLIPSQNNIQFLDFSYSSEVLTVLSFCFCVITRHPASHPSCFCPPPPHTARPHSLRKDLYLWFTHLSALLPGLVILTCQNTEADFCPPWKFFSFSLLP